MKFIQNPLSSFVFFNKMGHRAVECEMNGRKYSNKAFRN